jgi:nucleoside-diphosphate-sugar epimerase
LGSGIAHPLKEYIEQIRDVVAPGGALGIGEIPYSKNCVMNLCADISELTKDTGWTPKVNFEEGIQDLKNFYGG